MNFFNNKGCGICFEIVTEKEISLIAILDKKEYATVRCLNKREQCWESGRYFKNFEDAYSDYKQRLKQVI